MHNSSRFPVYVKGLIVFMGIIACAYIGVRLGNDPLDLASNIASSKSEEHYFVDDEQQSAHDSTTSTTPPSQPVTNQGDTVTTPTTPQNISWGMKFVNYNISESDFELLEENGITILSGEWGIDDVSLEETLWFLDRVQKHGMQYVVTLSDYSVWGEGKPKWQSAKAVEYVSQVKKHPAVYGYDISNEAGENLPHGDVYRISLEQMKEAAKSIREADPDRPILIRMHYWDDYDGDFTERNPFADELADVVMLNLYSSYSDDGKNPYLPDMIAVSGQDLVDRIHRIDPDVEIWISLAAFEEGGMFLKPTAEDIARDIRSAEKITGISNISFFGWGPTEDGWYLPRDGSGLWKAIVSLTK